MSARKVLKDHYEKNAAKGRTVRFTLLLDARYITDADVARTEGRLSRVSHKVSGGTLTPEQAKKILDIVYEGGLSEAEISK